MDSSVDINEVSGGRLLSQGQNKIVRFYTQKFWSIFNIYVVEGEAEENGKVWHLIIVERISNMQETSISASITYLFTQPHFGDLHSFSPHSPLKPTSVYSYIQVKIYTYLRVRERG